LKRERQNTESRRVSPTLRSTLLCLFIPAGVSMRQTGWWNAGIAGHPHHQQVASDPKVTIPSILPIHLFRGCSPYQTCEMIQL